MIVFSVGHIVRATSAARAAQSGLRLWTVSKSSACSCYSHPCCGKNAGPSPEKVT